MNKIYLSDVVNDTYTNVGGYNLFLYLEPKFLTNENIELSLNNSTPMASSFLNSSFAALVEKFGFDKFKNTIKLIDVPKNQADYLKKYFNALNEMCEDC